MLTIHTTGNWSRGSIRAQLIDSTRQILPEVEALVEQHWRNGQQRLGSRLFDGAMCRMESWRASADALELHVSPTSYRIFFGTNLNPVVADHFDTRAMANPIGVSAALLTSDGWLLLGWRNSSVAYYPDRVHPFAGSLEEQDLSNVFGAVERELREEVSLGRHDIESIHCLGLAEDQRIRQPELIFSTRVRRTLDQIERRVHKEEHRGSVAIERTDAAIEKALAAEIQLTPIARATLMLSKGCMDRGFRR